MAEWRSWAQSGSTRAVNLRPALAWWSMRKFTLPLFALLFAFHVTPAGNFALTVDNIMRGPGLYGYEPSQVRWSGDGDRIYFQWKQASDPRIQPPDTYVVGR